MRRWAIILLFFLLSAAAPALPGDGTVRITERTPSAAARPVMRDGAVGRSTLRPRRPRRRRPAIRPAETRPVVWDTRQGWQLLGALTDRLREISEAWFSAQEPRPTAAETAARDSQTFTATPPPFLPPPAAAVQQEARLLARVLQFCRRQTPSHRVEQAAWRRACDELLQVAHDCAATDETGRRGGGATGRRGETEGPAVSHRVAPSPARPVAPSRPPPPVDPLQRLEQMDDALARAQEIVARFLPAP